MVVYELGILPIICELQKPHPGITQPWYTDDDGESGTFEGIWQHLDDLMVRGTPRGYFLKTTKSILVVSPWNAPRAQAFFRSYGLQIVTGKRYLGGFLGPRRRSIDVWGRR